MRKLNLINVKWLSQRNRLNSKTCLDPGTLVPNYKPGSLCSLCLPPSLHTFSRNSQATLSGHSLLKKLQGPHCLPSKGRTPGLGLLSLPQSGPFLASAPTYLSLNLTCSVPVPPYTSSPALGWHFLWTLSPCTFCFLNWEWMPFTFPSAHQNPVNSMIWSWNHIMFSLSEFLRTSGSRRWTRRTWSSPPPTVSVCSSDIHPASTACQGSWGEGGLGAGGKI